MRLIDADMLFPDRMTDKGVAISQSQIANAPTMDPDRETGYWERSEELNATFCSKCGFRKYKDDPRVYNYCPNCGQALDWESEVKE